MDDAKTERSTDGPIGSGANGGAEGAEKAVLDEYEAALRSGTVAALELFVRRHPDHALAADARTCLAARQRDADTECARPVRPGE